MYQPRKSSFQRLNSIFHETEETSLPVSQGYYVIPLNPWCSSPKVAEMILILLSIEGSIHLQILQRLYMPFCSSVRRQLVLLFLGVCQWCREKIFVGQGVKKKNIVKQWLHRVLLVRCAWGTEVLREVKFQNLCHYHILRHVQSNTQTSTLSSSLHYWYHNPQLKDALAGQKEKHSPKAVQCLKTRSGIVGI